MTNFERKSARRAALLSGVGVLLCLGAAPLMVGCEEQGVEDTTLPPPDTTPETLPPPEEPVVIPPAEEPGGTGLDEPPVTDPAADPATEPEEPIGG